MTIIVPNSSYIVKKSTAIYHITLSVSNGEAMGKVAKKLKGPDNQKGNTVKIVSPFPEMSFPFHAWIKENTGKDIIVLGRWLPESDAISLVYGPGSTWPQGGARSMGKP